MARALALTGASELAAWDGLCARARELSRITERNLIMCFSRAARQAPDCIGAKSETQTAVSESLPGRERRRLPEAYRCRRPFSDERCSQSAISLPDTARNFGCPRDERWPQHRLPTAVWPSPLSRRTPESATASAGNRLLGSHYQSDNAARRGAHPGKSHALDSVLADIQRFPSSAANRDHPAERNIRFHREQKEHAGVRPCLTPARPCEPPAHAQAQSCRCQEALPSEQSFAKHRSGFAAKGLLCAAAQRNLVVWGFVLVVGAFHRDNRLRLPPLGVVPADHNVKAPVAPFFFRLYQAQRLHVEEVVFHPANLLFAQASPLQVDGHAR